MKNENSSDAAAANELECLSGSSKNVMVTGQLDDPIERRSIEVLMRNRPTNRIGRSWFPSTNKWGFPDLLPDMLGDKIPTELEVFRTGKFPPSKAAGKTVCFFIDDYRFESCYSYPQRMLNGLRNSQWYQVVEPDFSVWADAPLIDQMMAVYKTRWCGRYWQENGIRVIPVLSWGDEETFDYCFDGIPHQPPLAAIETQCRNGIEVDSFHKELYRALDIVRPKTLLIYGQPKWLELPPGQKFKLYKTFMGRRRQSLKKKADHGPKKTISKKES